MPKPKPKPESTRRQRWLPYVRQIADTIGLKDWAIKLPDELPAGDAIASVYPCAGRKIGTLRLSEDFLDYPPEKQRQVLVHELIHCHAATYIRAVEIRTDKDPVLTLLMEYMTDGLADGFAHLLPLPPRVK